MRYTVMLRERAPGHYVAVAPAIPECRAEGKTRQETLQSLRATLEEWMQQTEVTSIEISAGQVTPGVEQNPWLDTAGVFADDPTLEPLLRAIYAERDAERPFA
jgi:predicted RNase H-like HicB family nuclease